MKKRIIKIVTFLLVIAFIYFVSQQSWLKSFNQGGINELLLLIQDNVPQALIFIFLLMIVQNLFTLIPLPAIIGLALIADPNNKPFFFVWTFAASIIGATISFYLARLWLHRWAMNKMNASMKQKIEHNSFIIVFILRVLPFVPTSLINYSAGVSSARFWSYISATVIGNFIYFLILFFIGNHILEVNSVEGLMILVALVIGALFIVYKFIKPRLMKQLQK